MSPAKDEIWLPSPHFPNFYIVSNFGNVRSLRSDKLLKPTIHPKGYLYVDLRENNLRKNMKIHQLVALAFLPNPDNLKEVNHNNGNKQDNRVDNLCWCTRSYNVKHAFAYLGRCDKKRLGEANHNAKKYKVISPDGIVTLICGLNDFCRKQNLNPSQMSMVAQGKRNHHKNWRISFE